MTDAAESSEPHAVAEPLPWRAAALCLLLSALWGGTPTSIRIAGDSVPPLFGAAVRFWLASLFMFAWCAARRERLWPRPAERRPCALLGLFLFAQIALYHIGVTQTNASHGALFINTFIFWVAVVEHFVTRDDRLTGLRWIGLACAAAGVIVVLTTAGAGDSMTEFDPDERPTLRGDLITALSGLLLGIKIVVTKRFTRQVPPGTLILWHDVVGATLLLGAAVLTETVSLSGLTTGAVLALLYQGLLVGGFCFGAQTALLERYSASRVTAFNAASPVWGVGIAVLMLGDPLSPWLFVAAAAVAAGIVLVNKRPA